MLEVLTFLVIGIIISITINLALLCIIYIQCVNNQIKTLRICLAEQCVV
ncbi:MAG: hypothetical protein HFJ47_02155 [Clostridia bacterium]|nr:hypothetical protein [Clostridia bacterium]